MCRQCFSRRREQMTAGGAMIASPTIHPLKGPRNENSTSRISREELLLTLDKRDNFSGSSTNFLQSIADALGSVPDSGPSRRRDTREALRCLGGSRRSRLTGLGGSLGGGRGMSDRGPPGQELRLAQDGTGRCDGHLERKRLGEESKNAEKRQRG